MSHFTRAKVQIADADAFIAACATLGFTEVERNAQIKDYYGNAMLADVAVRAGRYHVALKKNENGRYDMVADWWGIRTSSREIGAKFGNDNAVADYLLKHTTRLTIEAKYKKQGFRCEWKEDDHGNINMALTRAAR